MGTLGFAALMFCGVALGQDFSIVEVARLPSYTEGPVFDHDGNLFVSEPFGNNVTRIEPDGLQVVWMTTAAPNGHRILPDGAHLLCDERAILRLDRQGNILHRTTTCGSSPVNLANDLAVDSHGGFYFTDPGPLTTFEEPTGKICYSHASGSTHLVAENLQFPNGIVLRTNGDAMLVSLTGASQIVEFPIIKPGVVGEMKVFVELAGDGVDGLALDGEDNLYFAGTGVEGGYVGVLGRTGEHKRTFKVPLADMSNLVFGGSDYDQLWLTGRPDPIDLSKPIPSQMAPEAGKRGLVYRLDFGPSEKQVDAVE